MTLVDDEWGHERSVELRLGRNGPPELRVLGVSAPKIILEYLGAKVLRRFNMFCIAAASTRLRAKIRWMGSNG